MMSERALLQVANIMQQGKGALSLLEVRALLMCVIQDSFSHSRVIALRHDTTRKDSFFMDIDEQTFKITVERKDV